MKKRTSVYIDAELLEFAKREGLNLSKLLETAIIRAKNGANIYIEGACRAPAPGSNPGRRICFCVLGNGKE